jgi:hypothetical protein
MSKCPVGYAVRVSKRSNRTYYRLIPVNCKSWSCPRCARMKTRQFVERCKLGFAGCRVRFGTLTFDTAHFSLDLAWRSQSALFAKLVRVARKRFAFTRYVKIVEAHKSGYPHLHFLIDCYVPVYWLSSVWEDIGAGKIVYMEEIPTDTAARYVTKYMAKNFSSFYGSENPFRYYSVRRMCFSVGFPVKEFTPSNEIRFLEKNYKESYERFLNYGSLLSSDDTPCHFTSDDLDEYYIADGGG